MNSRSVNENNLVNFSVDLSKLNTLDTKDGLLSFPFDHIYACHSDSTQRQQSLQLDKEVEIATHCVVDENKELVVVDEPAVDVSRLTARLTTSENQNKRLKDLLIYHLDLIQQQNDHITKREKSFQTLKQENDNLKSRLNRMDRRVTVNQRHTINPAPLVHVPPPPVTSTVVKTEPGSQIILDSLTELILPSDPTNPYLFDSGANKNKTTAPDPFGQPGTSTTNVPNYYTSDLSTSILENNINCENYTMIESKRSLVKKDFKTETHSNPLYTVTTNSGHPVIQRIQRNRRRTSTGFGSLSRMPKNLTPVIKTEPPENSKMFEDELNFGTFGLNKKTKMINTYGKQRTMTKCTSQFTGSLSDRLQLIDTTPTGEDPYQLGEADMREQSPIPKLMLQKNNHRSKISNTTSLRVTEPTTSKKKYDRFNLSSTFVSSDVKEPPKTIMVEDPDLDMVKTEPAIDWRIYDTDKSGTSLCDYTYGENSGNVTSYISPSLESMDFQELFPNESTLTLSSFADGFNPPAPLTVRRNVRTTSLIGPAGSEEYATEVKRGGGAKRGRKRALSTTGLIKTIKPETLQKVAPKPKLVKGKAACRGKKLPLPGLVTKKPYHTLVGDPDLTWYLGLDPDVKMEDLDPDPEESQVSSVEVPRWREKPYASCYSMEGTENLDDKVFEKRHQKLEAEERRQLRWHMRRVREQRHVERLRQRQRDPWGGSSAPTTYTVWPQPQKDVRFIEITKTLPVNAFGEILPAMPPSDFVLPWVRTSKASKRSKRSKTLH